MTAGARLVMATLVLVTCSAQRPFAWGDKGHQMTARIAAEHLTPAARRGIVKLIRASQDDIGLPDILGTNPEPSKGRVASALARMATWSDCMGLNANGKCKPKGITGPWHFIDVGVFEGPGHLDERCGSGSCITEKIPTLIDNLKAGGNLVVSDTLTFTPDRQLRFLIHFLGDIHQPLHTTTNADAGGNCQKMTTLKNLNPTVNSQLHAQWDSAIIQKALTTGHKTAVAILTEFSGEETAVAAVTDVASIAGESFAVAKAETYGNATPMVPTINHFVAVSSRKCSTEAPSEVLAVTVDGPTSFDNEEIRKLVREQLFKGGVRLAAILNQIFQ
jgi:hypothetical protein